MFETGFAGLEKSIVLLKNRVEALQEECVHVVAATLELKTTLLMLRIVSCTFES